MYQLILQIALSSLVIALAIGLQAWMIGIAMQHRPHVARRLPRLALSIMTVVISLCALWMLGAMTLGIWIWAFALQMVGAFSATEPALYFALAAYTTLGFGDVLPPEEWRIMGAMIGANGMLGFGLATAALIEFITGVQKDLS